MAEEKVVETPDVDDMSDAQVADLKNTMRETPAEEKPENEQKPETAKAADKPADKPEEEKQETVPHGQFHRERERRKEAERLSSIATQRLAELLEASRPQAQPQVDHDPEPDEPMEKLAWQSRRIERLERGLGQEYQQTQRQRQEESIVNLVAARFAEKEIEQPELKDISTYLATSYGREFAVLQGLQGMTADGQIIAHSPVQQAVIGQIKQIAIHCYNNGIPIEEYYANLAKARGWQPKQNGDARTRNDDGTFAKQETDRIDALEAAKRKAKSLGGTGAPVEMSEITPETLIAMSDEDFSAYKKKHGEKAMRKAFGAVN